ncbi:MAG TPA: glutamate ABC transporter substrate-binding protein, partial [Acidimicrobiia bacterium]|nr:glutamate ABC transporter substrate-binding protein [Acidimicrobiia bacterium]
MRRPVTLLASLAMLAAVAAGCASASNDANDEADRALQTPTTTAAPTTTTTPAPACDPARSERPDGPVPPVGQVPADSDMAAILKRGKLRVGVDQNTLFFGYRDPITGELDGFDIALAKEVATALFGNPDAIDLRAVTTLQRQTALQSGEVDLVASQYTANCGRRQILDLSTVYYVAHQKLLVRQGSRITGVADLAGKKVCATVGSTSLDNIKKLAPKAIVYRVPQRTDCLVALDEGKVDAITSDDTILLGFKLQDPDNTEILPQELSNEPYTLATSKSHPEFGRFVNAVLDQLRADGRLEQLYRQYLNRTD